MKKERALHLIAATKSSITAIENHPAVRGSKELQRLLFTHHANLQSILEEVGPVVGLNQEDIVAFGGGTPKTEDRD